MLYASALCIPATSGSAAPSEGGGSLPYWIFVLFAHSVFPFDGADVTICFAAERAADSTRSIASCDTRVNLCDRLSLAKSKMNRFTLLGLISVLLILVFVGSHQRGHAAISLGEDPELVAS
jgi:hypothetical protein